MTITRSDYQPLTHELAGKQCLRIDPDEQPRWG
jgi:hypothetical protein